jgi:hypothetical protein
VHAAPTERGGSCTLDPSPPRGGKPDCRLPITNLSPSRTAQIFCPPPRCGRMSRRTARGETGRVGRRAHRSRPLQSAGSYPAPRRSLRSRRAHFCLWMGQSPASSSWAGRADGLTDPGARRGHGLAYRRIPTARTRAPPRRPHGRERRVTEQNRTPRGRPDTSHALRIREIPCTFWLAGPYAAQSPAQSYPRLEDLPPEW